MPAQLLALDDGPSILLDKPVLLLGRHPECDVQIDSRKISRKHCVIAQVNDTLVVRDLGSTNGIRINGVRVAEGRLTSGDELTVGNCRYRLTWDTAIESPPVVARSRPRAAVRPDGSVRDLDDEALESCDEPVPLDEPGPLVRDLPLRPAGGGPAPGRPAPGHHALGLPPSLPPDPPEQEAVAPLLPDDIDLVPLSEIRPDKRPPEPPPPVEPV
jgi:predicted component of type VI protein secretion system